MTSAGGNARFVPTRPHAGAVDALAARILDSAAPARRYLLGIAGSPGSGKTTLAKALVKRINRVDPEIAAHLPMDGFHLANSTLDRLSIRDRKGAIETFDGWGFVALLDRLRHETDHTVYAPSFARAVDEGIAGEVGIEPKARIVVVEGNYLLIDHEPWSGVRARLDAAWFCATQPEERTARLVERHVRHGRSREAATAWAREVDGRNATHIEPTRARADLVLSGMTGEVLN